MPDTQFDRWLWRGVVALIGSVVRALGHPGGAPRPA